MVNRNVMNALKRIKFLMSFFPLLFIRAVLPIPQIAVSTVRKITGPAVA